MDIALRLVELRNKLGMSRTSFAKSIGITETHMKRFETGVAAPKEKHINTICEKYHINPAYFTGGVSIEEAIIPFKNDDDRKNAGKRLKQIRLGMNMTAKEFSSLINISYTHLYMVETGNNPLSEKMASEIADILTSSQACVADKMMKVKTIQPILNHTFHPRNMRCSRQAQRLRYCTSSSSRRYLKKICLVVHEIKERKSS